GRAVPKRCDNRPRDAQGIKHLDGAQLTLGITMRAQDDGPIAGLDAAGFDLAHDFGIERIDDMGDKDADIPGQLAVLIDGKKVRAVTVAGNRLFDPLTSRTPDAGRIIEIFRDRRPRDTADGRELFHIPDLLLFHTAPLVRLDAEAFFISRKDLI